MLAIIITHQCSHYSRVQNSLWPKQDDRTGEGKSCFPIFFSDVTLKIKKIKNSHSFCLRPYDHLVLIEKKWRKLHLLLFDRITLVLLYEFLLGK